MFDDDSQAFQKVYYTMQIIQGVSLWTNMWNYEPISDWNHIEDDNINLNEE